MKYTVCAALLAGVLVTGCGKNEQPEPQANQPLPGETNVAPTAPPVGTPLAPANTRIAAPDDGNVEVTKNQLTRELRRYIARTRSRPTSFEDFVARSQLQVPPPPSGKKWAISRDFKVVVVNQ